VLMFIARWQAPAFFQGNTLQKQMKPAKA